MAIRMTRAALLLAAACPIQAPASFAHGAPGEAAGSGSDLVFASGFEAQPPSAFASDTMGNRFVAFPLADPSAVVTIGPAGGTAFLLDFVGDDFSRAYGIDAFGSQVNTLATINTATGAITPIGTANPSVDAGGWTGFRFDRSTGVAYAIATSCGTASHLYTINLVSGASTLVAELDGMSCATQLAISPTGLFYALDLIDDSLYAIDATSGATTLIGPIGFDVGSDGNLDFDDSTGQLYFAGLNDDSGVEELRTLDPNALVGALDAASIIGFAIATEPAGASTTR